MRNLQKRMELVLTIALLGMTNRVSVGADWSGNSGLTNVSALAVDPNNQTTLYAGTLRGLYKSTDGGATWQLLNSSLNNVTALAIDSANSDIVYMGRTGISCWERARCRVMRA